MYKKADGQSYKKLDRKPDKNKSKSQRNKQEVVKLSSVKEKKEKLQREKEKSLRDEERALKEQKKQEEMVRTQEQELFLEWIDNKSNPISKSEKRGTINPKRIVKAKKPKSKAESDVQGEQFNEFKGFINNSFRKNQPLNLIKNHLTEEQSEKYGLFEPLLTVPITVGDLVKLRNYYDVSTYISFEIDVHGYKLLEFEKFMNQILTIKCKKEVRIICIHGQNQGTVLKDYVLKELQNTRIKERIVHPGNGGRTDLILR